MAEVFGQIGNQPVQLNNAATETTLRQLVEAVQQLAGSGAATRTAKIANDAISNINAAGESLGTVAESADDAAKATLTFEQRLQKANNASDLLRTSFENLEKQFGSFISKLAQGTANASDLYGSFTHLKGVVGLTAVVFQKVAAFQEENLKTYQDLSSAGVNFGGSLTQMRMAAQNSYMSLTEFSNLMKNNGEAFSRMGGTVNQGAMAFTKLSNSLLKSEAGDELRALGYTTAQVNQGMLNYINMTGGRTKEELKNTKDITAASVEYLTQLDGLAQLTGKSREQQEQALKEANQNAAIQQKMAGMDEKQKAAYLKGLAEMEGKFGKAGREMYQAQVLGIPPMTEAAKNLTALAPEVARASQGMADVAARGGTAAETMRHSAEATEGAVKASGRFTNVAGALSMQGGGVSESLMGLMKTSNQAIQQGRTSANAELAERAKILEEEKKRKESEAKSAVEAQKAIQEMGQALMAILLPAIKILTPIVNALTSVLGFVVKKFGELESVGTALVAMLIAYLAYQKIRNAKAAADEAKEKVKALTEKAGVTGVTGLGRLGTYSNPMYVIVMGKVAGGGKGGGGKSPSPAPAPAPAPAPSPAPGGSKFTKMGAMAKGITGGVGGILGGFALDAASKKLEESGNEKAAAGVGVASDVATYAGMGATLGSVVPGLGTAAGAIIGGVGGGAYSLYKNWGKLTGEKPEEEKPKMADGGVVTKPTEVLAGEAGPEAIIPLKQFESLRVELEMLNKQSAEMIKYLKETADYTKRNVDATKSLNGDLFKF
jgi:hypothetical protein